MEKSSIRIPFCEPINFGIQALEFLFLSENEAKVFGESSLKLLKVVSVGIVRRFFDSC